MRLLHRGRIDWASGAGGPRILSVHSILNILAGSKDITSLPPHVLEILCCSIHCSA
jgi:hypothetical protein